MDGNRYGTDFKYIWRIFLEEVSLLLIVCVLISGTWGDSGSRGIFSYIGTNIKNDNIDYIAYQDFKETYVNESNKSAPVIYSLGTHLYVGVNRLADYIMILDYEGGHLTMDVNSIKDNKGNEFIADYNPVTTEIDFTMSGIYTVDVEAKDRNNRVSRCIIQIPVSI